MRTSILRVAVLLSLSAFSFPFFANGQEADAVPSIVANEAGARLALKEKNSVFSIDLSANVPKSLHATLVAKILSPDDKLLAEASVSVHLSSTPQRAEVPLSWIPVNGLQDASSARLLYEVRLEGISVPAFSGILCKWRHISKARVTKSNFDHRWITERNRTFRQPVRDEKHCSRLSECSPLDVSKRWMH